jgi:hypothetical protein
MMLLYLVRYHNKLAFYFWHNPEGFQTKNVTYLPAQVITLGLVIHNRHETETVK